MEIIKSKAVKLRSHLNKYLVADDDRFTVRQSRNSATHRTIWLVDPSPEFTNSIRLRNFATGLHLTASDAPFLLGMTGKRVVQSSDDEVKVSVDWEIVRDGFQVKLKTTVKGEGKFLRANGGTPPWRNSVTHDVPISGATCNWTLWDLEAVEIPLTVAPDDWISPALSFVESDLSIDDLPVTGPFAASPMTIKLGMDFFSNAKSVRLRSHHGKYLAAGKDEDGVTQHRNASSRNTRWAVELVGNNYIRLKSCYGKYLTASHNPFLLGMTGCKVIQTLPSRHSRRFSSSEDFEWEPVVEGDRVKLRARNGNFLRANGGVPPWRNSVTHDAPYRAATRDWVVWDVDVIESVNQSDSNHYKKDLALPINQYSGEQPSDVAFSDSFSSETSFTSSSGGANGFSTQEFSTDSIVRSPPKLILLSPPKLGGNGRVMYYRIADEDGNVNDESYQLTFNSNNVEELTHKLEKYTGIEDIVVCTRSPLDGKLCPLCLKLPPNAVAMHVVVVPSTYPFA